MRLLAVLALSGVMSLAPLQCGAEPDPELRRNETPDEALYALAAEFRERGELSAWRTTLQHLLERYPNGRFAVRARQDLEQQP